MSSTTTGFKVKPKEKKEIMIEEESVKVLVQAQVVPDAPKVEEEIDGVTIEEVSITDD